MKKPSLFIATSCYTGKVDLNYCASMLMTMKFLGENRIPHMFNFVVATGIDASRSKHATEFLQTECTHLLFVDDDMAWAGDLPFRLLIEDLPVIGVPYRRKTVTPVKFTARHATELERLQDRPYLVKMDGLGTGMMLIKREVFEALAPKMPVIHDDKDSPQTIMFFRHELVEDALLGTKTYLSEDYNFCRLARDAGFDIWGHVDEEVAHTGNVAYRGVYADMLEQGNDLKLRETANKFKMRLVGER